MSLREAAQALLDRWDSQQDMDTKAGEALFESLRAALAETHKEQICYIQGTTEVMKSLVNEARDESNRFAGWEKEQLKPETESEEPGRRHRRRDER